MSQQLMSDGSLTPGSPDTRPSAVAQLHDYRRTKDVHPDLEPLRKQVSEIIDVILAGKSPDEAELREQLRRHVARHPGRPEKALLGHLISVSDRQNEAG
jgi:hypothetical protein